MRMATATTYADSGATIPAAVVDRLRAYGPWPPALFAGLAVALVAIVLALNASRVWLVVGVIVGGCAIVGFFSSKTAWRLLRPR